MTNTVTKNILSVSQLTYSIKQLLESNFKTIYVQGEVSNFKHQSSGHIYFSLKDKNAQVSCALFKGFANQLSKLPKDGDKIVVLGEISVYPPRGGYQVIVKKLQFAGVGELLLKLHQMKLELQKLGWFDKEHKKKLPTLPKRIGVITSPTGAVIQDIINVLSRRFSTFELILNPVKVQGDGAKDEIAKAIKDFNEHNLCDVMIVGRGGGSIEDLWPFNEMEVVSAIFESKIPVISAVGHETDVTLSDYVADVRAPTPSAAAEIVIAEKEALVNNLANNYKQILNALQSSIEKRKIKLQSISKQQTFSSPTALLSSYFQQIDEYQNNLDLSIKRILQRKKDFIESSKRSVYLFNPLTKLNFLKQRLFTFSKNLDTTFLKILQNKKSTFENKVKFLFSLDPKNLLKKGYSILFSEKKKAAILSINDLQKDDVISALLSDGKITAKVETIYDK
jgi:exodeoxyribonuclease VII large subunit